MIAVWATRAHGRSGAFAFRVNWLLMAWAIALAQFVPLRLPARYYRLRSFEQAVRLYDRMGVRWYRRGLRQFLWMVNPALLNRGRAPGST